MKSKNFLDKYKWGGGQENVVRIVHRELQL